VDIEAAYARLEAGAGALLREAEIAAAAAAAAGNGEAGALFRGCLALPPVVLPLAREREAIGWDDEPALGAAAEVRSAAAAPPIGAAA
jgi:hypothetical protein